MRHNIPARAAGTDGTPMILIGESADLDLIAGWLDCKLYPVLRYTAAELDAAEAKMASLATTDTIFSVVTDETSLGKMAVQDLSTTVKALPDYRGHERTSLTVLSATNPDQFKGQIKTINNRNRSPELGSLTGDCVIDTALNSCWARDGHTLRHDSIPMCLLLAMAATGCEGDVSKGAATPDSVGQQACIADYRQMQLNTFYSSSDTADPQRSADGIAAPVQVLVCDTGNWDRANGAMTNKLCDDLAYAGVSVRYFPAVAMDRLMAQAAKIREEGRQAVIIDAGAIPGYWGPALKSDAFLRLIEKEEPAAIRIFLDQYAPGNAPGQNPQVVAAAAHTTLDGLDRNKAYYALWRDTAQAIKRLLPAPSAPKTAPKPPAPGPFC